MKKILNNPEAYTDDMLRGIYAAHKGEVECVGGDLRCYVTANPVPGKVGIVTGGGTGHLPLFLGYARTCWTAAPSVAFSSPPPRSRSSRLPSASIREPAFSIYTATTLATL